MINETEIQIALGLRIVCSRCNEIVPIENINTNNLCNYCLIIMKRVKSMRREIQRRQRRKNAET